MMSANRAENRPDKDADDRLQKFLFDVFCFNRRSEFYALNFLFDFLDFLACVLLYFGLMPLFVCQNFNRRRHPVHVVSKLATL